jgi:hypothetical protein
MNTISKFSISDACAPTAGTHTTNDWDDSHIWSLTQTGAAMVGEESRVLSCLPHRRVDEYDNYQGETHYPVVGDIQAHPQVASLLKSLEWRAVVTVDHKTGLLYRKLPSPTGYSNSWASSGETAVQEWEGNWGQITSDHNARVYRFERSNLPGRRPPSFPNIDELINELLAEYVIDDLNDPVLQRILNPNADHEPEFLEPLDSPVTGAGDNDEEVY